MFTRPDLFSCGANENNHYRVTGGRGLVLEGTGLGRRRASLLGSAGESGDGPQGPPGKGENGARSWGPAFGFKAT